MTTRDLRVEIKIDGESACKVLREIHDVFSPSTREQLQMSIWAALVEYGYPVTTNAALAAADAVIRLRDLRENL